MINGQKTRSSVLLMTTAFLTALLFSTGSAAQPGPENEGNGDAQAQESAEEEGDKLFLTALDMGVLWFASPDLQTGFMVRTLADYRFNSGEGPFLRLNIDSTSTRIERKPSQNTPGFSAPMSINDVLLGGGVRMGSAHWQVALAGQAGVAIYGLPELKGDEVLSVFTTTRVAGAGRASVALEYYFEPDAAVGLELLGQGYFGQDEWSGLDGLSLGLVLGLATTL